MAASACQDGALVARGFPGAHHGLAHLAHDGADVGEVEVDQTFLDHQICDAGDARVEHLIGHREGVGEGRALVGDPEQVLVRDADQRVDGLLQFVDAGFGHTGTAGPFELERLRDDADRQDAHVPRRSGDDRRGTGPGAATHPGRDEAHVGAGQMVADFLDGFLGGRTADLGLRSGPEPFGHLQAHLDDAFGLGARQRLGIGIGHDEIDPDEARDDHVVDRIPAGAADSADHDAGLEFAQFGHLQVDRHRLASHVPVGPLASALSLARRRIRAAAAPRDCARTVNKSLTVNSFRVNLVASALRVPEETMPRRGQKLSFSHRLTRFM